MSNRIAPSDGIENHFDAVSWLNTLIVNIALAKDGEPHELTLGFLAEWRVHRQQIAECRHEITSWTYLGNMPFSQRVKTARHAFVLQQVGGIVSTLENMWTWPPPLTLPFNDIDIGQLKRFRDELSNCRSIVDVKY